MQLPVSRAIVATFVGSYHLESAGWAEPTMSRPTSMLHRCLVSSALSGTDQTAAIAGLCQGACHVPGCSPHPGAAGIALQPNAAEAARP